MKTYKDMADEVFRIGDERIKANKSKKKKAAAFLSVAAVFVLSVAVWQSGLFNRPEMKPDTDSEINTQTTLANKEKQETTSQNNTEKSKREITENNKSEIQDEEKSVPISPSKMKSETAIDSDGLSGGEIYGGTCIPAFPVKEGISYSGERLTDSEAKAYLDKNKVSIVSSLASSGVETDNITIKEKGYCHASYDGTEGKQLEVKLNFRDYLVYNGDKIVAIVTLWKENGKIYSSPAFGAPWFGDYTKYLEQHKGEKLVYVYAGWMEFIVAPDGNWHCPSGDNCSGYLEGIENLYERLYCPEIVYIP